MIDYIENPKDSLEKKNKTTTLELSSASLQNTNKKNKNQPYFYSSKHVRNEIKNIIPYIMYTVTLQNEILIYKSNNTCTGSICLKLQTDERNQRSK